MVVVQALRKVFEVERQYETGVAELPLLELPRILK